MILLIPINNGMEWTPLLLMVMAALVYIIFIVLVKS